MLNPVFPGIAIHGSWKNRNKMIKHAEIRKNIIEVER